MAVVVESSTQVRVAHDECELRHRSSGEPGKFSEDMVDMVLSDKCELERKSDGSTEGSTQENDTDDDTDLTLSEDEEPTTATGSESDSHRRELVLDAFWKVWALPGLLVSFVVLATFTSQSIFLLGQVSVMSILVYRGSQTARDARYQTPVSNVVRGALGSVLLGAADVAMTIAVWDRLWPSGLESAADAAAYLFAIFAMVLTRVFFAFAACAISDYMFHRFVWHAHWAQMDNSILFRAVWRQYLQHYLGHHRHVHDPETITKMSKLSEKPMSDARKLTIEQASSKTLNDQYVLWCSNHGITVGAEDDERVDFSMRWGCRLHTATMFLAMPCGTLAIINAIYGSVFGMLLHSASSAFTLYITFHHDKFHCNQAERQRWAASLYDVRSGPFVRRLANFIGSALWLSGGMDVVTKEHKKHHLCPENREEYYGLVPYGRWFVYPMWQSW